jgi:hypothetical protein
MKGRSFVCTIFICQRRPHRLCPVALARRRRAKPNNRSVAITRLLRYSYSFSSATLASIPPLDVSPATPLNGHFPMLISNTLCLLYLLLLHGGILPLNAQVDTSWL